YEPGSFRTDFTRYGEASHYRQPIRPGRDNRVLLRLPLRHELGGNTGYVSGYVTFQGRPVRDPQRNLVIRAFSLGSGPECGIEGFAASAERLQPGSSGTATYYRTPPLAAARCVARRSACAGTLPRGPWARAGSAASAAAPQPRDGWGPDNGSESRANR